MKSLIFAKKRTTKEGKVFYTYLTTLTKKDGEEIVTQVKFREECGSPKSDNCPMYIEYNKVDANFNSTKETYTDEDGEVHESTRNTLWISNWTESADKYVDTSMDDFV